MQKKIRVSRTFGEFEMLEEKCKRIHGISFKSYLIREMRKLSKEFNDNPSAVTHAYGKKISKDVWVNNQDVYNTIAQISSIMQTSMPAVINDFIVIPLILEKEK